MLSLTVWMNMPSFYQDDLFRALVATGEVDLRVVFARDLEEDRKRLGWRSEPGGYAFRKLSHPRAVGEARRIAREERDRVHLVNAIWAEPSFTAALFTLGRQGSTIAVYSEAPEPTVRRGPAKRLIRRALARWVARRASGMLAIARVAEDFYRDLGFRDDQIYPWGYFRASPWGSTPPERPARDGTTELLYLGQLIHRKGLDLLLDALEPLLRAEPGLRLALVGQGADGPALEARVRAAGLAGQVTFEGPLAPEKIPARVAAADLLVLPSRWDGWGLVVNEAFAAGVPVLASSMCGASDLIRDGENGYVFRSEDVEDLRGCLSAFLALEEDQEILRAGACVTGRTLAVDVAARYLIDGLLAMRDGTPKPRPPWRPEEAGPV